MTDARPNSTRHRDSTIFLRFLASGGFAAVINWSSRFFFDIFTSFSVAIVLAFMCGLTSAFILNKLFVFTTSTQSTTHSAAWFTVINLFALVQTWVVTMVLASSVFPFLGLAFHPEAVAHAVGIVLPVFTSYIGHKRLSFREDL